MRLQFQTQYKIYSVCLCIVKHNIFRSFFFSIHIVCCCYFPTPFFPFFFSFSSSISAFNHETLYPFDPIERKSTENCVSNSFHSTFCSFKFCFSFFSSMVQCTIFIRNIQYDACASDSVFFLHFLYTNMCMCACMYGKGMRPLSVRLC